MHPAGCRSAFGAAVSASRHRIRKGPRNACLHSRDITARRVLDLHPTRTG
jgi:hypothetical protein